MNLRRKERSFTLKLGDCSFTGNGGLIIIEECVSLIHDGSCETIKAAENCELSVVIRDGYYTYSAVARKIS